MTQKPRVSVQYSTPEGIHEAILRDNELSYKQQRLLSFQADMLLMWTAVNAGMSPERTLDWTEALARHYMNLCELDAFEELELAVEHGKRDGPDLLRLMNSKGMNAHEILVAILAQKKLKEQQTLRDRVALHREAAMKDYKLSSKWRESKSKGEGK